MSFELHPRLAADTLWIGDASLSRLLLMNDQQYPWAILVPRRQSVREIYQLCDADQQQLWRESAALSRVLMETFNGYKLNVAALGNLVPQLHLHHVVRHLDDPSWPGPVWGKLPPQPYESAVGQSRIAQLREALAETLTLTLTLAAVRAPA